MSHEKVGPNELRLRELRQARFDKQAKPKPKKLIPFAGKDPGGRGPARADPANPKPPRNRKNLKGKTA